MMRRGIRFAFLALTIAMLALVAGFGLSLGEPTLDPGRDAVLQSRGWYISACSVRGRATLSLAILGPWSFSHSSGPVGTGFELPYAVAQRECFGHRYQKIVSDTGVVAGPEGPIASVTYHEFLFPMADFLWICGALLLVILLLLRKPRSNRVGFCTKCGYDLTLNVSGQCPECGTAIPKAGEAGVASQTK